MKRNWRNKDGRKLPRIEIIRDSLSKYLQEEKFKVYRSSSNNQIELFCLGMGFQTLMHLTDIDLSHEQEHYLNDTLQTAHRLFDNIDSQIKAREEKIAFLS